MDNLKFLSETNDTKPAIKNSIDFQLIKSVKAHLGYFDDILILSSGNLVTDSRDTTLKEWNTRENFKLSHEVTVREKDYWFQSMVELDNGLLAVAAYQRIRIFDTKNNYKLVHTIDAHEGLVQHLIRLRSRYIVSCSDDSKIKVWDPENNFSLVKTLSGHIHSVAYLFEMSNGVLVSSGYDSTIKFWNIQNDFQLIGSADYFAFSLEEVKGDLAFGTNSSGSFDIKLMALSDYSIKGSFKGHVKGVVKLKMLASGFLASASRDGSVKFWDVETYAQANSLVIDEVHGLTCMTQLEDGSLVTAGYDDFHVWAVPTNSQNEY